ncbi:retrovirus-related pol polyprotein from transposon TNT 1-94 [Tanacetum coccineum]
MVSNQAIKYAPQCGDVTVESLVFQTSNVVGNFNYLPTVPTYKPICKFLMNFPLKTAFTKCPLVLYQNFLWEFWYTTIAYDPNPSTNENKPHSLKEFLIKFIVMNGKKPLTLDFNTFTTSTGLDYNNGTYVAHPSPEVLSGNYSSTKQVNSIQQLITYSLITRTKDENFGYLPGILSNSSFSKDLFKVTEIELTAHMIAVNNQKDSVFPLPLSTKKKKGKTQTVTPTLPKSYGPEASGSLSKKRKQPKPQKTPSETKVSSPKPTEDFEQSHSVSLGTVLDPQDLERNIQLASMGLPSTLDEGTRKSQPLPKGMDKTTPCPEGPLGDKDLGGNKPPADMEPINPIIADPSGTCAKYQVDHTQSTKLRYQSLTRNEALLLSDDERVQESDEEEVFEAGEDMDEDTQANIKFDNILPLTERQLVKYLRKVSRVFFNKLTEAQWTQHKEAAIFYADLKASIEGYYEENIDHNDQTDKVIDAAMNSLDKNSIARGDLLNALNGATEALKAIQDAVKEGHSLVESLQATALTQEEQLASWAKSSTSMAWNLSPRITAVEKIYQSLKADTKEASSHTEREHAAMEEEPKNAVPITTVKPTEIPTLKVQPIITIISTSQPEPFVPQREGKAIVTDDQPEDQRKLVPASKEIQAHLDKEEKIKKAVEEAKMFEMTKTEVIKVVPEEAKKIGLYPKKIISVKAVASQSSGRKRKHMELEPEIKVAWLECNRSLHDGVPFVNNMVIEEPEYGIFFIDVFDATRAIPNMGFNLVDVEGVCSSKMTWASDSLGKFDRKSDEGYLLGYSTSSKAFRVYNKRTKRVEENLHINFLEDQPNVAGTGTQDSYVAGSSGKDKGPTQEYILLPLQPHRTRIPVKDVVQIAQEKPSKNASSDKDV